MHQRLSVGGASHVALSKAIASADVNDRNGGRGAIVKADRSPQNRNSRHGEVSLSASAVGIAIGGSLGAWRAWLSGSTHTLGVIDR